MNKSTLLLALLCAAALSCNTVKIKTYEEQFQFPLVEATDSLGTYVEYKVEYYESFKGDKELTERMNTTIRDSVFFGKWSGILSAERALLPKTYKEGDFHSCAKSAALIFHLNEAWNEGLEGAINYYEHKGHYYWDDNEDYDQDSSAPLAWRALSEGSFLDQFKDFQNYGIECSIYSGGAHGNTYYTPVVFNLDTGEIVKIADIIPNENNHKLLTIARKKGHYPGDENLLFSGDTMPERFTLDETGITWYTQPYEWGPQVMSFTLSWEDLKPLLSPGFNK